MLDTAFIFLGIAALYLLPSAIAYGRGHPRTEAIFNVNAWLGLTVVGWIFALAWACAPYRHA